MTRSLVLLLLVLALPVPLAACGGPKKHAVSKLDFQAVHDYVDKNMRATAVSADERRKYTVSQLGPPHRTEGDTLYWYSAAVDCYYLQLGEDGWASWGIAATSDCKRWAIKP